MKWSRPTALAAGLAVITVSNMVALGGAAYNREGEPDSTLLLTQRELRPPFVWVGGKENSGLSLQMRWRVLPSVVPNASSYLYSSDGGGAAAWLDAPKLASLGFDRANSTDQHQLPRDVLVVLELDGPAYQEAFGRAKQAARDVEAKNERGNGQKEAQAIMDGESRLNSRLFAVDVGLDRDTLRGKFPDRTKYAIVRGQVRPAWAQAGEAISGVIDSLSAASVNVPLQMRGVLEGVVPVNFGEPNDEGGHFEARVAFGRRLEPWLVSTVKK